MPNVGDYALVPDLDVDDSHAVWKNGAFRRAIPEVALGYRNASHFADVDEQVINTCETITGFTTSMATQDGGIIQLDPVIFTTGANSVKAKIYTNRGAGGGAPSSFYWVAPSDIPIGDHVEVAFNLRGDTLDASQLRRTRAFVGTGTTDRTGTINYAEDFIRQFPDDADHNETWYQIRLPLTGMTVVRSIGITQMSLPAVSTSGRSWFWFDNMALREATGIDRAVYGATANSHIVIPATYTSAKTQLPIFNEAAGVTWEDRR